MYHSLSQTLVCSYHPSLLDTLNFPCLPFNLQPSTLLLALCSQLSDSVPDSYVVADTVGTPQLDLWGLPLCQVCSLSSVFHVYAIELRITTVSLCHICSAQPNLRVSYYMSGLVSVLPSQWPATEGQVWAVAHGNWTSKHGVWGCNGTKYDFFFVELEFDYGNVAV